MTMLHLTEERLLELIDMKADELFAAIEELKADPIQKNWVDADRIEELEAKLDWVIVERDETFALMLDRAQTAEAKLAKATDTLARIVRGDDDAHNWAIWTLAELTGKTDD